MMILFYCLLSRTLIPKNYRSGDQQLRSQRILKRRSKRSTCRKPKNLKFSMTRQFHLKLGQSLLSHILQNQQSNMNVYKPNADYFSDLFILSQLSDDALHIISICCFCFELDQIKVIFDNIQSQRNMQQRIDANTQENIEITKKNCVNLLDSFSRVIE